MQLIRVWFTKTDAAKYISHLDLNRSMIRAVRRAQIPIWYTEGFNPHPFLTFALPLSLGIEGRRESMDMKLLEPMDFAEVRERLNGALPPELQVVEVREAVQKPKVIASALYELTLQISGAEAKEARFLVEQVLSQEEIIVPRRTKSGIKDFDLAPEMGKYTCEIQDEKILLSITLPAGSRKNVNPVVVVDALSKYLERGVQAGIRRMEIYDEKHAVFC